MRRSTIFRRGWSGRFLLVASLFFILLYMIFTKVFPIVSIWEMREGREKSVAEVQRTDQNLSARYSGGMKSMIPGAERHSGESGTSLSGSSFSGRIEEGSHHESQELHFSGVCFVIFFLIVSTCPLPRPFSLKIRPKEPASLSAKGASSVMP